MVDGPGIGLRSGPTAAVCPGSGAGNEETRPGNGYKMTGYRLPVPTRASLAPTCHPA